ncbi:MAG: hypothetical protein LC704_02260 [Actinobacteria bacterium]|nr:hypothetical protein [Actinomycetota bacterium]
MGTGGACKISGRSRGVGGETTGSTEVRVDNVPPTISNIPDQITDEDTPTGDVLFTVGDAGTSPDNLTVRGSSSNTALVPGDNITFGGSGENRTVTVTPANNQSGTTEITVEVSDGDAEATEAFILTVNAADREAPTVKSFFPIGNMVSPKTRVTATFSEPMDVSTLRDQEGRSTTFVLTRNGVRRVPATVRYGASG